MKVLKYIITLLILIILFNISLYIVSFIPSELLIDNARESAAQLEEETDHYEILTKYVTLDNFTDALMINESISIDSSNPLESYLKIRKNYNKNTTKYEVPEKSMQLLSYADNKVENDKPVPDEIYDSIKELINFINNDLNISSEYARYYHGYLIYLRPLLLLFNINGIRCINFIVFLVLLFVLAYELYKKLGLKYMFAVCFSILAFEYLFVALSLNFSSVFIISIVAMIIILVFIEKFNWDSMKYLCIFTGALTCFFDYFTVPTISLTLPLLIFTLYLTKEKKVDNKELFKNIFVTCIMWGLAYALTWISKWIIYDIFMENSIFNAVIEQLKYRSFSKPTMFLECFNTILIHFAVVLLIYIVTTFLIRKKVFEDNFKLNNKWLLIFISCIPLLFDIVTFNHYIDHSFFTYRDLIPLFTMIWLIYFDSSCKLKNPIRTKKNK